MSLLEHDTTRKGRVYENAMYKRYVRKRYENFSIKRAFMACVHIKHLPKSLVVTDSYRGEEKPQLNTKVTGDDGFLSRGGEASIQCESHWRR